MDQLHGNSGHRRSSSASSDLSPLIPKLNTNISKWGNCRSSCGEYSHCTLRRLEELKNWLWIQQQNHPEERKIGCISIKWVVRGLQPICHLLRKASTERRLSDSKKRQINGEGVKNAQIQRAVSVAGVAAAIAAVASATASASANNESESKTGSAVASAAALVAAHCADLARDLGAGSSELASALKDAMNVKSSADILNLTATATNLLQGSTTLKPKAKSVSRIHAAWPPCGRLNSSFETLNLNSKLQGRETESSYIFHLITRGCDFVVRYDDGKLHQRNVSVYLGIQKEVIAKLRNVHMNRKFSLVRKRIVSNIINNVPPWPGRSLILGNEHNYYFGLQTSHGTLEFECRSEADHRLWTDGISHLLFLSNQKITT